MGGRGGASVVLAHWAQARSIGAGRIGHSAWIAGVILSHFMRYHVMSSLKVWLVTFAA